MKSAAPCGGGAKAQIQSQTAGSNYSAKPPSPQALCRRLDVICAEVAANLRRQRQAERLHRLGPRPMLEALAEVEAGRTLDTCWSNSPGSTSKPISGPRHD